MFSISAPSLEGAAVTTPPARHHGKELRNGPKINVVAIGGPHQFAHLIPVACELESRHPGAVTLFTAAASDTKEIAEMAHALSMRMPRVFELALPRALEASLPAGIEKFARLVRHARRIANADLVLTAERTSTILRRLVRGFPLLFHIPHGAGDRAIGFERRFELFDDVLVAGQKDRDRLVAAGRVTVDNCVVTGPVKLAAVFRQSRCRRPLFANERRTILYNPHFSKGLSSFESFARRLIDAVRDDGRFNLVVAPHVRLGARMSPVQRRFWEQLSVPDQILVDMGSARCNDMTYTLGADLYLGDVSSQVYEFLVHPRPCLFVDAAGTCWENDESYAMWHFGTVVRPHNDPIKAIERAFATHAAYVRWQKERMAYALHGIAWTAEGSPFLEGPDPIDVAARHISQRLEAARNAQLLSAAACRNIPVSR